MKKSIYGYINAETEYSSNVLEKAMAYEQNGADGLYIYNYDANEKEQMKFLETVKMILKKVDIPLLIGCYVKRFEDVKKALYTGATYAVVPYGADFPKEEIGKAIDRFGKDKLLVEFNCDPETTNGEYRNAELLNSLKELGIAGFIFKHVTPDDVKKQIAASPLPVLVRDSLVRNDIESLLSLENVSGVLTNYYVGKNIIKVKNSLRDFGIDTKCLVSAMAFSEFKTDANGLVPVVVQDYKTSEVLMVAYMNEEAYNKTIATGRMTYFSRSRNELWVKGETSGHYQFLKELRIDCDNDTILAKVHQLGAACHTGNVSCFFTELCRKEYSNYNPLSVLTEDYNIILDRKVNPKEGSYTNYLFDKGIDKILKKCGEEATEITIAAKNPDKEELKYEIADYLYHLMVLMVECDVDWNDIVKELANRRKS
ncbi:MAG: bifunctional phosphoribosyl-AMP cyclohydrolase/phosphoribosyl-ATP diphosphatase HisIE [Lachnospiraceae bacterium]|jgi:phosphoribosyl-ATP pyrophosphohydrolase/phosphoribosyl-AMP cyclohydrolase|nr:bifunctional phosphoribosyl-AMP cyclohydrolase/phosphoribosyl-ATP diphosphatase HisIE [Lachnospiraceae bacterium]